MSEEKQDTIPQDSVLLRASRHATLTFDRLDFGFSSVLRDE